MKLITESFIFGLLLNPFTLIVFWGNLLLLIFVKWKTRLKPTDADKLDGM